jgi:hypothetical protein
LQAHLIGILIVALIIGGSIALGTISPKSDQKPLNIARYERFAPPRYEPFVPLEMPRVELPSIQPLTPVLAEVDPCLTATEVQCRRRSACRWENFCVDDHRRGNRKCTDGVCRGKRETGSPKKISVLAETPTAPLARDDKGALPSPPTSTIAKSRRKNAIAPLTIGSEAGTNYLVKLVNVADEKDQIMIFVKGGESYSTKVPLGSYRIRAASGSTWYGRNDLFGPETQFFRLRSKKDDESSVFKFTQQSNKILGMTISFKKVFQGNMEQEKISRIEF